MYVHSCQELVNKGLPLTDTERYEIAYEVTSILNNATSTETTLSARLKALRQRSGKKLINLSDETGLSVSYLSDIERGRTNPSLETCAKLAKVYKVTLAQLFQDVG